MGLKEALERYEKATAWTEAALLEDAEKHYQNYRKVVDDVRMAFDNHIKNVLGYNPYENYEELLEELK